MTDEHRTGARADRLRRFVDPSASTDPRVVAVLDQLSAVAREQATVTPRPEFRAELRAQLVAITPRIVAEYAPANGGTEITGKRAAQQVAVLDRPRPSPRPHADQEPSRTTRPPRRSFLQALRTVPVLRPLAVVASLVTVLALVLGGAVWMSQDSAPGDTLYGLKRASERFELSLADNDTERAQKYLEFAGTRVEEARELVSRASASAAGSGPLADGALSPQTSSLVAEALNSADGDTQTASRLLGGVAVDSASPAPLRTLTDWAPSQLTRLTDLRAAVPAGTPANAAATKSTSLLQTAKVRAATLQQRVGCNCLQNAPTDAYGPLPTPGPATSVPRTKAPTSTPAAPGNSRTTAPKQGGRTSGTPAGGSTPGQTTSVRPPILQLPSLRLPTAAPQTSRPNFDLCKINLLGIRICASPSK